MASFEWWWRSHASFSFSVDEPPVEPPEIGNKVRTYFSPNATILTRLWNCNPRWQLLLCLSIAYTVGQLVVWPEFLLDVLEAQPGDWHCELRPNLTMDPGATSLQYGLIPLNDSHPEPCEPVRDFPCDTWTYQPLTDDGGMRSTLLSQLKFICPTDLRNCEIGRRAGAIAGSILLTMIADRKGRKFTTLFFAVLAVGLALSLGVTKSQGRYLVVNIFFGLFRQVPSVTGLVWAVEFIPPCRRSIVALGMHGCVVLHWLFLGLLALALRTPEALHFIATFWIVPGLALLGLLSNESLGFLIAKNKYKTVKKIIRQRADRVNRTQFPVTEVESLQMRADATAHYLDDEEELSGGPPYLSALGKQYNLYDLVHSPRLLTWTLVSLLLWCLIAFLSHVTYLALPYSSVSAIHDFLIRGACQLPAYLGGAVLMFAFDGRSKSILSCHLLALIPVCLALGWFLEPGHVRCGLAFLAFILVSFCKATLVLLCIEMYPTSMRCLGLGLNFAAGSSISILCFVVARQLTFGLALGAACTIVPGIVLFWCFFPDTRDRPLPESLYEIEQWKTPVVSSVCRCIWKLFRKPITYTEYDLSESPTQNTAS